MLDLPILINKKKTNSSTQQVLLRVSIYMVRERNGQSLDERQHAVEISTIARTTHPHTHTSVRNRRDNENLTQLMLANIAHRGHVHT
jgi:hypothetical protein